MKRILFADAAISVAASLCLLTSAAQAADVPIAKAPGVPAMVRQSWTGFYAGVHGGYAWNKLSADVFNLGTSQTIALPFRSEPSGSIFGAQAGANYEFPNHVVLGIVADISRGRMKGDGDLSLLFGSSSTTETKVGNTWWTVRGKLGYGLDNLLLYATAGIARGYSTIEMSNSAVSTFATTGSVKHTGWVAGAGAEMRLVGNWSIGAEYRYLSLGTETHCFQDILIVTSCASVKWRGHQAIATLNYQF
jgi:outer membrane immunogenic protein